MTLDLHGSPSSCGAPSRLARESSQPVLLYLRLLCAVQTRILINTHEETPDSLHQVRLRLQTLAEELFLMQEV